MELVMSGTMVGLDFTGEIDRGVGWLSGQDERWFDRINLDELQLSSVLSCVLGQLAMSTFRERIERLFEATGDRYPASLGYHAVLAATGNGDDWAARRGFHVDRREVANLLDVAVDGIMDDPWSWQNRLAWETLTVQWAERIEKLRAEAGTALP